MPALPRPQQRSHHALCQVKRGGHQRLLQRGVCVAAPAARCQADAQLRQHLQQPGTSTGSGFSRRLAGKAQLRSRVQRSAPRGARGHQQAHSGQQRLVAFGAGA